LEYFERKRKQVPIAHGELHTRYSIDPISDVAYIGDPAYVFDFLDRYKVVMVPTNANWSTSIVGSGVVMQTPLYISARSGTTANSQGLAYIYQRGLVSGNTTATSIDWRKYLEWRFILDRANSDPECVARVQLKESYAQGALAQQGIGLEISNYNVKGESYGVARGTVNLVNLSNDVGYIFKIVKKSNAVEFYVNNALKGQITNPDYIPNVSSTVFSCFVVSMVNGSTGGVNAIVNVTNIVAIQEV
jgi:hypothetical protein